MADLGVGHRLGILEGIPGTLALGDTVEGHLEGLGTQAVAETEWLEEEELGGAQGEGLQVPQGQGEEKTLVDSSVGTVVVRA